MTLTRPLILFLYANQYADLLGAMARDLRARYGIESALVILDRSFLPDPSIYDFREDDFIEIIDLSSEITPRSGAALPSRSELAERSLMLEQRLGISVNEMIRSDRHAGLGFVLGGDYPRSRYAASLNYDQAVDIVLRVAERTQALIARRLPIAVVGSPADIARSTFVAVTERAGVPLRIPGPSFSNVRFQWKVNKYYWPANLIDSFTRALRATQPSPEDSRPVTDVPDTDRTQYARRYVRQAVRIRTLLRHIYNDLRRQLGHLIKRRRPIYGGTPFWSNLRLQVRLWNARRRAIRQKPLLDTLNDTPFVLYPLAVEPETTLQSECPTCDNQLALIDWLAKTVPGGWRVVVKEHPGFTTPRPAGFYERIRRYPNVLPAAPYESGERLASRSRAVALINGSLGFQAALAGVPVLVFSPTWFGRVLPHVLHASSYETTREALMRIADERTLPPITERKRQAKALLAALEEGSIELQSLDILRERAVGKPVPTDDLRAICESLVKSLEIPSEHTTIPFDKVGASVKLRQSSLADLASFDEPSVAAR